MQEKGIVVSQKNNVVEVEVVRVSACGDNCSSCGGGCNTSGVIVSATTDTKLVPGDIVVIEASSSTILLSTAIAYLIPLVLLLIGSVGGATIFRNYGMTEYELAGFGIGVLSLIVSFFLIRFLGNRMAEKKIKFEVVRIDRKVER